jgi:hypothetical protein
MWPRKTSNEVTMLTKKENTHAQSQYLGERQLAARWGVSVAKLQADRHAKRGVPYLKLVGVVRYRLDDVLAFEQSTLIAPANTHKGGRR